jgi:hypothetical protein
MGLATLERNFGRAAWNVAEFWHQISISSTKRRKTWIALASRRTFRMRADFQPAVRCSNTPALTVVSKCAAGLLWSQRYIQITFKIYFLRQEKSNISPFQRSFGLIFDKDLITVYSENYNQPVNTLRGRNAELLTVKASGAYSYHRTLRG